MTERLRHIMEALAEHSLTLPEDDLAEDFEAAGLDPDVEAASTLALLKQVGRDYRQRFLREAAAEYRTRVAELSTRWVDLPDAPEDRRTLLEWIFTRHPMMKEAFLTV